MAVNLSTFSWWVAKLAEIMIKVRQQAALVANY